MSEIIKYRQTKVSPYDIQNLPLKDFTADVNKVKLFTEEDSRRLKDEASHFVSESEVQAAKILKDAEEEARTLIVLAEKKVEDFRKEGLRQGYEEGLKKAEAEMEEKYSKLFQAEAEQLRVFLEALKNSYKDVIKTAESPLVKLAMDIAEKVIKSEAEKNSQVVLNNIRDALSRVSAKASIVVRVNPDQFDLVEESKKKLCSFVEGIDSFELKPDSKVDKGGCVIETPSGSVEARIEKQISELKKITGIQDKEESDVSGNT